MSEKIARNDNARKTRPTVQLYRPGMLRGATAAKDRIPAVIEQTKKQQDSKKVLGNKKDLNEKIDNRKLLDYDNEKISEALRHDYNGSERDYILNKNDYTNLGRRDRNRRRDSCGSSNSGTIKVEANLNTPERKNSINKSYDHIADNFDSPKQRPGRRLYSSSNNYYSSSQSLCESSLIQNRDFNHNSPGSLRYGKKAISRYQNRTQDRNSAQDNIRSRNQKERYPSSATYRYQQHQTRNDHSEGDTKRNSSKYRDFSIRDGSGEGPAYLDGNGSRRTDYTRNSPLDRRQNWSFRSSHSERYEHNRYYRKNKGISADRASSTFQDSSQDLTRKESEAKKSGGTASKHMSFQDLCASLDSIDLASFDWSSEVEAEERRKKEREERERKRTEQSSESGLCSFRKDRFYDGCSGSESKNDNYASTAGTGSDRLHSNRGGELPPGREHFISRFLPRQRNDSFTSQTSSIAESIEEQSDIEEGSGEKTPTNDEKMLVLNSAKQGRIVKEKGCYLDEELPIIIRGREHYSSFTNYRGEHEYRGRNKRGNRWRTRKPVNHSEVEAVKSDDKSSEPPYVDDAKNSTGIESSVTTSVVPIAISPTAARNMTDLKNTLSTVPKIARQGNSEASSSIEISSTSAEISTEQSVKKAGKSRLQKELPPTEWPIHLEISNNEGPQIQVLNDTINHLIDRITESADPSAGEEILVTSEKLSQLYLSIVTRDIDYTYTMNLEQHLWKQCFYSSIEALRAASNSTGNVSRLFRTSLSKLIQQGLAFYAFLLNRYEVSFGFVIDDYLYWQSGLPTDDFVGCVLVGSGALEATDRIVKVALLSVQRLAVSVGDLHRYNAMVSGIKDYSEARLWYHKAAQLGAGNGRSYNQLALLAVYTIIQRTPMRSARDVAFFRTGSFIRANKCKLQMQLALKAAMTIGASSMSDNGDEIYSTYSWDFYLFYHSVLHGFAHFSMSKWIDVVFYYVRALAARYPFETARQPLFTAFNHVQKKVSEFEIEFNARVGDSLKREAETAAARADRPHEIWIAQDGRQSSGDYANIADSRAIHMLDSISAVELFRRTVPYLLHSAGLLITKIGMEEYESISERALFQLSQLLSRDQCPLSSLHLVQLSTLFLFAVQSLSLKNSEPDTCSLQQQQAVQMVLSLFGVVLKPVHEQLADLPTILDGSVPLPSKMRRVLPAVFVISEWLSMPTVNRLYGNMPSLESIETSLIQINTWKLFADVANTLVTAESKGILSRTLAHSNTDTEKCSQIVLPEMVFLASFIDVFTVLPKSLRMSFLTNIDLRNNSRLLALHARLSSLLSTAEYLDGSELPCFGFDENLRRFAATRSVSPVTVQSTEKVKYKVELNQQCDNTELKQNTTEQDLDHFSDEHNQYRQTVRDNQIKQELLERETKGNRVVIEVRPQFLVPDTNTFIDHLESIKRIVESRRFTVCVPTTVLAELKGLSQPVNSSKLTIGIQEDLQDNWVCERAKEAVSYLRDVEEKRLPQIYTVTSKGNRLSTLSFVAEDSCAAREEKTVNDDIILASCIRLTATLPMPSTATQSSSAAAHSVMDIEQTPRLYRSVVLLTEDRALNIKAVCANIPCRTVPSFMKWAAFQ